MFFEPTTAWSVSRRLLFQAVFCLNWGGLGWCSKSNEKGLLDGSFRLELEPAAACFRLAEI
jgi:hypothetical protein